MTFEQWLKRPVYVAQCRTWKLAAELDLCSVRFRALPAYRDEQAREARRTVAQEMRRRRSH